MQGSTSSGGGLRPSSPGSLGMTTVAAGAPSSTPPEKRKLFAATGGMILAALGLLSTLFLWEGYLALEHWTPPHDLSASEVLSLGPQETVRNLKPQKLVDGADAVYVSSSSRASVESVAEAVAQEDAEAERLASRAPLDDRVEEPPAIGSMLREGDSAHSAEATMPSMSSGRAAAKPTRDMNAPIPTWYRADRKYFVYQPSGGISNQRKILEWALHVCRLLNRVCVLPPIGEHTTWYYKYNDLAYSAMSRADHVFDIDAMRTPIAQQGAGVDLVVLNETLATFALNHESSLGGNWKVVERLVPREKRANPWPSEEVQSRFLDEPAQFLYFAKGTMWQCFNFTDTEMTTVQRGVRFHPALRSVARELSGVVAENGGPYNSIHIRFADGEANKVRVSWLKPSRVFMYRMRMAKFLDYSKKVYVATVPSKITSPYFTAFKSVYDLTFSDTLLQLHEDDANMRDESRLLKQILERYPAPMRSTILGCVEQLVCARGEKFLGTGFSTFSETIRIMRRLRVTSADPRALDGSLGAAVQTKELEYMAKDTPCWKETRPC